MAKRETDAGADRESPWLRMLALALAVFAVI
jgi:hypothetical protein